MLDRRSNEGESDRSGGFPIARQNTFEEELELIMEKYVMAKLE